MKEREEKIDALKKLITLGYVYYQHVIDELAELRPDLKKRYPYSCDDFFCKEIENADDATINELMLTAEFEKVSELTEYVFETAYHLLKSEERKELKKVYEIKDDFNFSCCDIKLSYDKNKAREMIDFIDNNFSIFKVSGEDNIQIFIFTQKDDIQLLTINNLINELTNEIDNNSHIHNVLERFRNLSSINRDKIYNFMNKVDFDF